MSFRRPRLCALILVVAAMAPARTDAQPQPVRVAAESIFGEGTLLPDGWVPVVITAENLTSGDLRGEVRLVASDYTGESMRRVADLDLPARARRTVVMPVFAPNSGGFLRATFHAHGAELGRAQMSTAYAAGGRSVVVFDDPPRLRGGLLDLDVYDGLASGGRQIRVPVGVIRFEAETSDPVLPTSALGYATVRVLVASTPALARTGPEARAAIEDWLRAGGRLLVFPRTASELGDEWLISLAGRASPIMGAGPADPLVARTAAMYSLACADTQLTERFGCSRGVGRGRVYLASYDGMRASAIESGAPRELVRSIYGATNAPAPVFALGAGADNAMTGVVVGPGGPRRVRELLDPNEGFRPALVLVAIVLLLYVFVVGPINFRWVQKRGRPTLALLTTPAAAFACVLLLLAVGYIGKGVRMRYSRVELVESVEGDARGTARRYTGFFATRPGSYDLPGTGPDGLARRIGASASRGPVHHHQGATVELRDIRTGLWETVFLSEDRMVALGGPVRFERDGPRLASVTNATTSMLRGAIVVDTAGAAYPIGDLPPGVTSPIGRAPEGSFRRNAVQPTQLARLMHEGPEEHDLVEGLFGLTGDAFVPRDAPVLYARLPSDAAEIGAFGVERVARWIRVAALPHAVPLSRAPPAQADPYATVASPQAGAADEGELGDVDAAAPDASALGTGGDAGP